MTTTFPEPVCLNPDGGSASGEIQFDVRNIGTGPLSSVTLVDNRAVATTGAQLFFQFLVCPTQSAGVCEFRTNDPQNLPGCRFSLSEGEHFSCAIPQTVTTTTVQFGDNATLTATDACGDNVTASSQNVVHVSTSCSP